MQFGLVFCAFLYAKYCAHAASFAGACIHPLPAPFNDTLSGYVGLCSALQISWPFKKAFRVQTLPRLPLTRSSGHDIARYNILTRLSMTVCVCVCVTNGQRIMYVLFVSCLCFIFIL